MADSLKLAREIQADAKTMLERGSHRSAADRAYYSMFHAANAILAHDGVEVPRTHGGLHAAFGKHLIETEELSRELGRWLTEGYRLRQRGDYDVYADLAPDQVQEAVDRCGKFIQVAEEYAAG